MAAVLALCLTLLACENGGVPSTPSETDTLLAAKSNVLFVDERQRRILAYSGYFRNVSTTPNTNYSGDASSFDEMLELQRSGYQLSVTVYWQGLQDYTSDLEAAIVNVTKGPLGYEDKGATAGGFWMSTFYERHGIPALQFSKWFWFLPPYVTIRDDSELRSVAEIIAAVESGDRICLYRDGIVVATYSTQVYVIGAWRMTGTSSEAESACRSRE